MAELDMDHLQGQAKMLTTVLANLIRIEHHGEYIREMLKQYEINPNGVSDPANRSLLNGMEYTRNQLTRMVDKTE